ncbi:hypothetical protein [Sphingomonas glacialis]
MPHGHPDRYDWAFMQALCVRCHIDVHRQGPIILTVVFNHGK